jgi:hypothetical protein
MVQPDAWALIPFVPVSWYGVDRPFALSGFAGTTMSQDTLAAAAGAVAVAVAVAVGQIVGAADAVAVVVAAVVAGAVAAVVAGAVAAVVAGAVAAVVAGAVAAVVAAAVAGAVATGAATVPLGVGATVAAVLAGVVAAAVPAAAVAPTAVLVDDGVAQAPATLAALLAPNTLPMFGISNAPPTPPTTATAPTIARSRVRDRGSNLRSWLKTLLLYDTTPFPFNRVYRSRAITVALPLCRFTQNQDFLIFARTAVIGNSRRSSISAVQSPVDQDKKRPVKTPLVTVITL